MSFFMPLSPEKDWIKLNISIDDQKEHKKNYNIVNHFSKVEIPL